MGQFVAKMGHKAICYDFSNIMKIVIWWWEIVMWRTSFEKERVYCLTEVRILLGLDSIIKQCRGKWQKEENDLCDQEEEEVEDVELVTIAPCLGV